MDPNMGNGAETKIAHLQMIQAVITRLAGYSFMVKGWTVTLVTALFALAAADANGFFVYVAYLPAVMFWALVSRDALRQWGLAATERIRKSAESAEDSGSPGKLYDQAFERRC